MPKTCRQFFASFETLPSVDSSGLFYDLLVDHLWRRFGIEEVDVIIAAHLVKLQATIAQISHQTQHIFTAGQSIPIAIEELHVEANVL